MNAKHTSGPLEVIAGPKKIESSSYIAAIQADDPHVNIKIHGSSKETCEAYARLIIAAPDLLESLTNLCDELHKGRKYNVKKDYSLLIADSMARKAIAKATGKR